MIFEVRISRNAVRQLRKVPSHVAEKLQVWAVLVATSGLEQARRVPGYHDEPLKGQRAGQRSIRLSGGYRAIYEELTDGSVEFASVEEVSKHDY
jgi:proteic killer suppression protein